MSEPPSSEHSPNVWPKILCYILATLILGAALAPWLQKAGTEVVKSGWLAKQSWGGSWHRSIERADIGRYFNRSVMIMALLLLWPTARCLRFKGWREFGLSRNPCKGMDLVAGFLLAFGLLMTMGAGFLYSGFFVPDNEPGWHRLGAFAISAIMVGFLEEVFFRGFLLGVLSRSMKWGAMVLTTVIYAAVHFIKAPEIKEAWTKTPEWFSGFRVLGRVFSGLSHNSHLLAEFATLMMLGLVLAFARQRTRSLWLPIGLHVGWVFGFKIYQAVTERGPQKLQAGIWVGDTIKEGLLPLIVILATGVFASLWVDLSRRQVYAAEASS